MEIGMIFTGTYFTGRVEVLGIDEANNKLRVALTKPLREGEKDSGFTNWNEDWDLQHTKWGFDRGEYFIKNFPDYPPTYFGDTKEPCNIYSVVNSVACDFCGQPAMEGKTHCDKCACLRVI